MTSTQESGRIGDWLQRHSGWVIAAAAVVVSAMQVCNSRNQSDAALTFQKSSRARDSALAERQFRQEAANVEADRAAAERQWRLNLAQFVAANHRELFSTDGPTRERMKGILTISYPESLWSPVFTSLVRASDNPAIRRTYSSVQISSPRIDSTGPGRRGVITFVIGGTGQLTMDPFLFRRLDVYMRRTDLPLDSKNPARRVGPASDLALTVRGVSIGSYEFWLQDRDSTQGRFSDTRLLVFDTDEPIVVNLRVPTHQ